jgi:hypothetical protein
MQFGQLVSLRRTPRIVSMILQDSEAVPISHLAPGRRHPVALPGMRQKGQKWD